MIRPENYDEIQAVIDLVWGDHPELKTKADVANASRLKILAMRREAQHAQDCANAEAYIRACQRWPQLTDRVSDSWDCGFTDCTDSFTESEVYIEHLKDVHGTGLVHER